MWGPQLCKGLCPWAVQGAPIPGLPLWNLFEVEASPLLLISPSKP